MKLIDFGIYTLISRKRDRDTKALSPRKYADNTRFYAGHELLNAEEINEYIYNQIKRKEPFMACRWGGFELANVKKVDFPYHRPGNNNINDTFHFLCTNAGFFPEDILLMPEFARIMKESCKEADFLAVWFHQFEDYYIKKYMKKDLKLGYLLDFEPWAAQKHHWSAALEGMKVLVIHPFDESIRMQYRRREKIFPGTDILPQFELKTFKAIQTAGGCKDERFNTWFDALEYMFDEVMKIDFDIAILGCGAYGMPLAAKLKKCGKMAIHFGGATQLLFGIKGRRWDKMDEFAYVRDHYNENWIYPSMCETPEGSKRVENACYWK